VRNARSGIAGVEAVNIFDEHAPRPQLMRKEHRGQVRAAPAENRSVTAFVSTNKPRKDNDCTLRLTNQSEYINRHRNRISDAADGAQPCLHFVKQARCDADFLQCQRQQSRRGRFTSGQ
jgi:hypothetical protein